MDELDLFPLAATAIGVLLFTAGPKRDATTRARWRRAAEDLGLTFVPGSWKGSDTVRGTVGGYAIQIDIARRRGATFTLTAPYFRMRPQFSLRRAVKFTSWDPIHPGVEETNQSLATGDDDFDRNFVLGGPCVGVLPRLDHAARRTIAAVLEGHEIEVTGAEVHFSPQDVIQGSAWLENRIADLVRIAAALELKMPLLEKLRINVTSPFEPLEFRLKNLHILLDEFPDSAVTKATCRTLLTSGNVEEMLPAAIALGADPEAFEAARGIARSEAVPQSYRSAALAYLAATFEPNAIAPIVEACAASAVPEVSAEALLIAVRIGMPSAARLLLDALTLASQHPKALIAAAAGARVLAKTSTPDWLDRAEAALIVALRSSDPSARIAVAQALAEVGTLRAVEPLLQFAKALLVDPEVKRAARAAIQQIQRRHPQAESGHLSVLDGAEKGGLSVTERSEGELSLEHRQSR